MKKKTGVIIGLLIAAAVVFMIMAAAVPKHSFRTNFNPVITVENGKAAPEFLQSVMEIGKGGRYVITADWYENEMPGFMTGFSMTDEAGNVIYSIAGGRLKFDSMPMDLAGGRYVCRFDYLCSEADYKAYAQAHQISAETGELGGLFRDGAFEMHYVLKIYESDRWKDIAVIACGLVLGLILAAIILMLARKSDAKTTRYDERQIAVQGKSYKLGFFTMIAYAALMMAFSSYVGELAEIGVLLLIGIILGAAVTITGLILQDAYFRLDENRRFYGAFFIVITVFNLGMGIVNIIRGNAAMNGKISFTGTANLLLGILSGYVVLLLLIKYIRDKKEETA